MEEKLLLLGIISSQRVHGYQMNQMIEKHLGLSGHLTKPTAYRLLNKMADDGWLTYHEERESNRPPRRVYSITEVGEVAFLRMLREDLGSYQPSLFHGDIGLAFMHCLPTQEVISLLNQRLDGLDRILDAHPEENEEHSSHNIMLDHQRKHLITEREWIVEVIERKKKEFVDTSIQGGSSSTS